MRKGYGKRRSRADGGAAWISYSDMMAALILLFVLVLSYTMYQYYTMLDSKTVELENQAALLSTQSETLTQQQAEIEEKQSMLAQRESELDDANAQLAQKETLLSAQQQALNAQESIISATKAELTAKEEELSRQTTALASANLELETNQEALATASAQLEANQQALATASAQLEAKQQELASAAAQLESNQKELAAATARLDEQQQTMQTQQRRLDDLVGLRTQIVRELTEALTKSEVAATVDRNTGDIMLESSVFFDVGKSTIKEEGRKFLDQFIPVYLDVLLKPENRDYLGEIVIEGHTDTSGTYLKNLELSQNRALVVAKYCLEMDFLTEEQREQLQKILTAKGRSFSDPIYKEDGTVDMDASRRVEFKFRMKDTEMIDEIRGILAENE